MFSNLPLGSKLYREKLNGFGRHYGIFLGRNKCNVPLVIHNTAEKGVSICLWNEFAKGKTVFVEQIPVSGMEKDVVDRALKLIGKPYDFVNFNCEHFANYVINRDVKCQQFQVVGRMLLVSLLVCSGYSLLSKRRASSS